jgi:cation transport ATPase
LLKDTTKSKTNKTGTITEGRPRVTQFIPFNCNWGEEILRVAAAIDTHSQHPLAQAVVTCAQDELADYVPVMKVLSTHPAPAGAPVDPIAWKHRNKPASCFSYLQ